MKKVAFYHVYLTDDSGTWINLLLEQFKCMEDSNLLKTLDSLYITCITKRDDRTSCFEELVKLYYPKANITFYENPFNSDQDMIEALNSWDRGNNEIQIQMPSENVTKRKIYEYVKNEDAYVLYFHSKGITSIKRHLRPGRMNLVRNYQYWRHYLNWGVLENWKACTDSLVEADVAGVNFMMEPSPHFSGNFWWSKSEHIRKLPDPSTIEWYKTLQNKSTDLWFRHASTRFSDEQWICCIPNTKVYRVANTKPEENPAGVYMPREKYAHHRISFE